MAQVQANTASWRRRLALMVRQRPVLGVALALVAGLLVGACAGGSVMASGAAEGGSWGGSGIEVKRAHDGAGDDAEGDGTSSSDANGLTDEEATAEAKDAIVVDVAGAVASPGVVELKDGARVADALGAAGGLAEDADLTSVNRAARLTDGQRVYVPRVGEQVAPVEGDGSAGAAGEGTQSTATGQVVNINTAGLAELDALPGVGPATAQAIIDDREANGPFTAPEDLMRVSGIGEKKFEKLKSSICV
ncbi:helix-hairpin-helix domain-containing protein [Collinsella stercoris]|uniref:helix-hairpin-helix domain-containing protein n=1 Tax=Collinsella stercoris TaxID=147206 RepID=UPI003995A92A